MGVVVVANAAETAGDPARAVTPVCRNLSWVSAILPPAAILARCSRARLSSETYPTMKRASGTNGTDTSKQRDNIGWQNVGCRPRLYRVSALGKNTRHRSVKCFPPSRSWLRLFRMVGIILNTVASNVLSPFHTQTLTEVLAAQAMRPFCKAAAIARSAPESARAHSILQSVASSLAVST